jgi:hypothetical protein
MYFACSAELPQRVYVVTNSQQSDCVCANLQNSHSVCEYFCFQSREVPPLQQSRSFFRKTPRAPKYSTTKFTKFRFCGDFAENRPPSLLRENPSTARPLPPSLPSLSPPSRRRTAPPFTSTVSLPVVVVRCCRRRAAPPPTPCLCPTPSLTARSGYPPLPPLPTASSCNVCSSSSSISSYTSSLPSLHILLVLIFSLLGFVSQQRRWRGAGVLVRREGDRKTVRCWGAGAQGRRQEDS